MKWIEIRIEVETGGDMMPLELVADLLYEMGVKGVVIEDGIADREADWVSGAKPVGAPESVTGYFPNDTWSAPRHIRLIALLDTLKQRVEFQYRLICRDIDEEKWSKSWKKFFHPIRAGKRLLIKPTWRHVESDPKAIILELDPGMAFGTGSHPTTRLCLELIEKYLEPGDVCLDVGAGSGILMVAAAHLGAARVVGVDLDPMAMAVAGRNLALNRVPSNRYDLVAGSLVQAMQGSFHLVSANILTEVIVSLLDDIQPVLKPGGMFICSGMIEKNTHLVQDKMRRLGMRVVENRSEDGWVAIGARRDQ